MQSKKDSLMVLLLGASSGLGKALAKLFAQKGFQLYLAGRNTDELERDAADLRIRFGIEVSVFAFDAAQTDRHADFYRQLPQPPDWVVCLFGYLGDQQLAAADHFGEAGKILTANLVGAVSVMNVAANQMEARGHGCLIGISSVAGERGRQKNYIYGAAKAGFTTYLSGLRNRLSKKGVHVLTVIPGFMDTKMLEGQAAPKLLTISPENAAKDIWQAARRKSNICYTAWYWRWIMLIIRNIPEGVFKKMNL
jgi:short-subunit dehydrogenase